MKVFGNYETLEELSSHTNSRVFRSRDRVLQNEAVVHVFSSEKLTVASRQRLHREIEGAARLSHSHIASVVDFGEQDGAIWAALEPIDGEDLKRFLTRGGALSLDAKVQLMAQVCDGLAFAHENGVIHRAINPAAILISASGLAKISDFGFADAIALQTRPHYLAPEQLRYQRGDARSDIFSATMVFFELLTGKPPFFRNDIIHEILYEEAASITDVKQDLPTALASIIARGLAKDPAARFQRASDFAEEIRSASLATPVRAEEIPKQESEISKRKTVAKRASAPPPTPAPMAAAPMQPVVASEPQAAPRSFNTVVNGTPEKIQPPAQVAASPLATITSVKKIGLSKVPIAAGALIVALVGAFLALSSTGGSATIMGTALIAHDTVLRPQPATASGDVGPALKAQPVEFLKNLPERQAEAWVQVRLKSNGLTGFVQNDDLDAVDTADAGFNLWHATLSLENPEGLSEAELSGHVARVQQMMDRYPQNVTEDMRSKVARAQSVLTQKQAPTQPHTQAQLSRSAPQLQPQKPPSPVQTEQTEAALDGYDRAYAKAQSDFDNATTEAQLRNIIKQCDPMLKPGLFRQQHGRDLQAKCQQLKDRSLKAIEIIQKG